MARIEGVDLPRQKRIEIALTYIFGIGRATALKILEDAQVDRAIRTQDLSEVEVARIREVIQRRVKVEGELRKEIAWNPYKNETRYICVKAKRDNRIEKKVTKIRMNK